jgi:hypothetical protein
LKNEPVDEPTSRQNELKRIEPISHQNEPKTIDPSSLQTHSRFIIWIEQCLKKSSGGNNGEREEGVESETKRMKVAFKEGPHRKKKLLRI